MDCCVYSCASLTLFLLVLTYANDRCSDGTIQVRDNLQLPELRQNIIQLFFKHLTSPDDSIIATAQQGLAHVISNHKMPKGLLQLSLRPILVNLAYHNKLKLPLLKGLARLLQLLASWFNVTLGKPQPLISCLSMPGVFTGTVATSAEAGGHLVYTFYILKNPPKP